jgi:hypothetical protein
MNESQPPVLEETATPNRFARFAARFSVVAPLTAILIYVFFGFLAVSSHFKSTATEIIVFGLLPMLLMLVY